jgi:hypothetical protein
MDASAEQLVLEYLRRLGDAAQRVLSPDERLSFMAGVRKGLARKIGESGATGADDIQRLLRLLGDPGDIAARERRRLDTAARAAGSADASTGDDPAGARGAGPADVRPAPGSPASPPDAGPAPGSPASPPDAGPAPGIPAAAATSDKPATSASPATPATPAKQRRHRPVKPTTVQRPVTPPLSQRPFVPPQLHRPMTARWRPGDGLAAPRQRRRGPPAGNGAGASLPGPADPPDRPGRVTSGSDSPPAPPALPGLPAPHGPPGPAGPRNFRAGSGMQPPGPAGPAAPSRQVSVLALVRKHPLETAAILLLGLGGLIDPFPLWLLGALAALASRLWDVRDKSAALGLPVLLALIGGIVVAGLTARSGTVAGFAHAVRVDGWDLMRAGAVCGAAYLAWRVRRGRRPRREPPWRRPQK